MQVLKLPKGESGAVALVCFVGEGLDPNLYKALEQHEQTLATLLWSRPRYAIPKWAATRGRPRVALITALVMVCLLLLCPFLIEPLVPWWSSRFKNEYCRFPLKPRLKKYLSNQGMKSKRGKHCFSLMVVHSFGTAIH